MYVATFVIYPIAQNSGRGNFWQINRFRVLARKTLANLNCNVYVCTYVDLEFGWIKYVQITFVSPNSPPKLPPAPFCSI